MVLMLMKYNLPILTFMDHTFVLYLKSHHPQKLKNKNKSSFWSMINFKLIYHESLRQVIGFIYLFLHVDV